MGQSLHVPDLADKSLSINDAQRNVMRPRDTLVVYRKLHLTLAPTP